MQLHKNVYFKVSLKSIKVFWKIWIFSRIGAIKQFLRFDCISPWCRRVVMHVYWIYMSTIKIYIKRAFFWVVKHFCVISGSKDIEFFPNGKFTQFWHKKCWRQHKIYVFCNLVLFYETSHGFLYSYQFLCSLAHFYGF